MKGPDLDRERSEKVLTQKEFLVAYNEGLPPSYPPASAPLLKLFNTKFPQYFKIEGGWSLDQHRKRVMDWLPAHLREESQP